MSSDIVLKRGCVCNMRSENFVFIVERVLAKGPIHDDEIEEYLKLQLDGGILGLNPFDDPKKNRRITELVLEGIQAWIEADKVANHLSRGDTEEIENMAKEIRCFLQESGGNEQKQRA